MYKTRFSRQQLPSEWTQSWESLESQHELSLPAPNPYIATNFDLIEVVSQVITHLVTDPDRKLVLK